MTVDKSLLFCEPVCDALQLMLDYSEIYQFLVYVLDGVLRAARQSPILEYIILFIVLRDD
jgi:hypothetical protein